MSYESPSGRVLVSAKFSTLYVSRDSGLSLVSRTLPGLARVIVGRNPDRTPTGELYGEFRTSDDTFLRPSCELRKSSDLGATWVVVGTKSDRCTFAIDPSNAAVMYSRVVYPSIVGLDAVMRSTDAGATWSRVDRTLPLAPDYLEVGDDGSVYGVNSGRFLAASVDRGDTWTGRTLPPQAGGVFAELRAGTHPTLGPRYVVIATVNGVFESSDGGASWVAAGLQGRSVGSINVAVDTARVPRMVSTVGEVAHWRSDGFDTVSLGLPVSNVYDISIDGLYVSTRAAHFVCANLSACTGPPGALVALAGTPVPIPLAHPVATIALVIAVAWTAAATLKT